MAVKVCPIVLRLRGGVEVLAFRHPRAGLQIVKGTVEPGEAIEAAALRELAEESGVTGARIAGRFGVHPINGDEWHLVRVQVSDLPESWVHHCADDGGHDFAFFWHRLADGTGDAWHPVFREALSHVARAAEGLSL